MCKWSVNTNTVKILKDWILENYYSFIKPKYNSTLI